MSRSLADRVEELETNYGDLYDAARKVVEKWETGELAEAVNALSNLLDDQDNIP